jgi:16S rRNA (cytosine967-C5)-methyltransferase
MAQPHRSALAEELRAAAQALEALDAGHRLDVAIEKIRGEAGLPPDSLPAVRDMASAAVRSLGTCRAVSLLLSDRAPTGPVAALQWLALSQLIDPIRHPAVIVDQAVRAAQADRRTAPAAGFLNATLRGFLRRCDELLARARTDPEGRWNHPRWWVELLRSEQPARWEQVLALADRPPALTLRVNLRRTDPSTYMSLLAQAGRQGRRVGEAGIVVEPACSVHELPGWEAGLVSVQDEGAQRAALWLDVADGQRVLDACAAPGGKTAHLLELARLRLTALDLEGPRLERVEKGLARLGLAAELIEADAGQPDSWWDGELFDRILVDAPCSASGIVRRAPDARWLRRRSDLATFSRSQARLLEALWPLLKPGGKLLYATCSVFNAEGCDVAKRFLQSHHDATELALPAAERAAATQRGPGIQLLPTASLELEHDGFYYCLIEKRRR